MNALERQAQRYVNSQVRFEASGMRYEEAATLHEDGQGSVLRVGVRGLCHIVNSLRLSLDQQSFQTQGLWAGVPRVAGEPLEAAQRIVNIAKEA